LRSHDRAATIPSTLVALDEAGDWLGSVSLLAEDHPDIPHYSPWLASLYVRPEARGAGIGRALVARAVAEAGQVGTRTLYLYCKPDVAGWYRPLGWRDHDLLRLGPLEVHVLAIDCGDHRGGRLRDRTGRGSRRRGLASACRRATRGGVRAARGRRARARRHRLRDPGTLRPPWPHAAVRRGPGRRRRGTGGGGHARSV